MKRPADLSDEALVVALAVAEATREHDGRLSARIAHAELEIETLERMFARSPEQSS